MGVATCRDSFENLEQKMFLPPGDSSEGEVRAAAEIGSNKVTFEGDSLVMVSAFLNQGLPLEWFNLVAPRTIYL